jgi:hypothetical protein
MARLSDMWRWRETWLRPTCVVGCLISLISRSASYLDVVSFRSFPIAVSQFLDIIDSER